MEKLQGVGGSPSKFQAWKEREWNSLEMKDFHEYLQLYNEGREGQKDGEEILKNQLTENYIKVWHFCRRISVVKCLGG